MAAADDTARNAELAPYVARLVRRWSLEPDGPRHRTLDGSLVSVDVSGFTALAERLATRGNAGAEELVHRISSVFEELIAVAERHGGDVLKFRGDALLLLFLGDRHPARACGAASDMQDAIERIGDAESSVGPVRLRMAAGVHSGPCHVFLAASPHRELLVAGPAATRVFELEDLAEAGQIAVSAETAAAVDASWLLGEVGGARLLRRLEPGSSPVPAPEHVDGAGLERYVPGPLRDHLAVASGEAEHRQATIAFVKASGVGGVLAAEGTEGLLERLDRLGAAVGEACGRFGLTWLESDIDVDAVKLYLTGGAPSSSGEDEEAMLLALRAVLSADVGLTLRAGVTRGHVFTGDIGADSRRSYAVMGDVVNLAARLVARAGVGQLLASADVLDRAGTVYRTETVPLLVKGKERAVHAHVVLEPVGARPRRVHDTAVVGRERELADLRAALDEARIRRAQLVELVGEPGIGKSRLVQELRGLALGFQQLEAGGEHYASAEPYAAFRAIVRQLVGITPGNSREEAGEQLTALVGGMMPDLAPWLPLLAAVADARVPATVETDALDPAASRERLHAAVEAFLERFLLMPTLLVVEDAHWLDDASLELLRHLVARPAARPWLVCVTRRPGGAPIAAAGGPGITVELGPIDPDSAALLALAVAGEHALSAETVAALAARSAGNPLFVRELAVAATEDGDVEALPETIESLLTTRIDTLDPADRMLLRYASVVGPVFELDLLGEVLAEAQPGAASPERWAYLGEFVEPADDGALAFRHDLVRATAYEGLSFRRRREIHARLGAVLEEQLGERAEEEAAALSLHFLEGGEHAKAWAYARAAAARAHEGFANVVAAELYERALAAAEGLPHLESAELATVWESLGDVRERFGELERAAHAYTRARGLAGGPVSEARLLGKEANLCERAGRYDEGMELYARGLGLLDGAGSPPGADAVRAHLEIGRTGIHYRRAEYEQAIAAGTRAAGHAEAAGDRRELAHAYYMLDAAHTDLGSREGLAYLERALPIYEELGDLFGQGKVLNNLGVHAYYEGRWDESLAFYHRSREVKERVGDVLGAAVQSNNEGEILADQGRYEEAEALFEEWLRACRAAGWAFGTGVGLSNLGRLAARRGSFEEAGRLLGEALAVFEELGSERFCNEARARRAEAHVLAGHHREALDLAGSVVAAAARSPVGGLEALLERTIGYALWQGRRPGEALPHFEESLRRARELDALYEVALTLRALADAQPDGEAFRAESDELLARLGVVRVPTVPLP